MFSFPLLDLTVREITNWASQFSLKKFRFHLKFNLSQKIRNIHLSIDHAISGRYSCVQEGDQFTNMLEMMFMIWVWGIEFANDRKSDHFFEQT
jgi:hypothetical protein